MKKRLEKKKRILVLIDFENLVISARDRNGIEPVKFSIDFGFKKIIENITNEIGEIVGVFVFLPSTIWDKDLYQLGFNIVLCPRIKDKKGMEQDTTDSRLMELGEWLINNIEGLTHLCIGSGDKDFSPLMRKAALKGLKKVVVAADIRSLSSELIELADKNPSTGKKMVYLFSPTKE